MVFKLDIRGQQGSIGGEGNEPEDFACAYARSIFLLHGGEGWVTGDKFTVTMDSAKGRTITGTAQGNSGRSNNCLLYTSPSPRDLRASRMPSSA